MLNVGTIEYCCCCLHRDLCANLTPEVPLAQSKLIDLNLPAERSKSAGRAPGLYSVLVMPKYAGKPG